MRGLAGQVVLVTGGGSGIGAAVCAYLSENGAKVAVIDKNIDSAISVAAKISGAGGKALPVEVDISEQEQCHDGIANVERELGPVSSLVNNAGWDRACSFVESDSVLWGKLIAVNLLGHLQMTHAILPRMIKQGYGRVVNVSSDAARVGSAGEAVYSACKGGMISFTKSLAREVAREGITTNVVCPGLTDTPLLDSVLGDGDAGARLRAGAIRAIPMKRVGVPEDLAGLIAFFCSDESSYITGQVVSVSGGLTMSG